jgi:hypothetical protein
VILCKYENVKMNANEDDYSKDDVEDKCLVLFYEVPSFFARRRIRG